MNNEIISLPSNVRFLLITANTGSIFEKPELLIIWINEFAELIRKYPVDFIALHCQEVGGKEYEKYMHILDQFIKDLVDIPELTTDFHRHRLYFDSDYQSQETFTALGCAYFFRNNLSVQQWNFSTLCFQPIVNRQIFAGSLVNAQTIRRGKYPREFFPEAKWSRKGFTQTRWLINDFTFDLLNVHLFHDASNLLAAERSPSIYSKCRRNALNYTLENLPPDTSGNVVPFIIFGDFNFRLDAHRLVEHLSDKRDDLVDKIKQDNSDEISKIIIRNEDNQPKLTIEKKGFNLHDKHDEFFNHNTRQANTFDFEFSSFNDHLYEYEKNFPPSYPYSEERHEARSYLRARCPAWCDRILLSHSFKNFINTEISQPTYDIAGYDVCVGDHKPVYLCLTVNTISETNLKEHKYLNHNDHQRTTLAHHIFHANIKHTIIRFLRETPV